VAEDARPPSAELSARQRAVLAAAFRRLLSDGEPVPASALAADMSVDERDVEADLAHLTGIGRIRRDGDGAVLGSLGLTLVETRHTLCVDGTVRHTWCALDAVGILGALEADGWIESVNPQTGRTHRVDYTRGRPGEPQPPCVLFVAEGTPVGSVIDEWCPLVNFLDDEAAASAWMAERGVSGRTYSVEKGTERGAAMWRPYIGSSKAV
jgi:Alkylmercury lyase